MKLISPLLLLFPKDTYDELMVIIGSRRSGLNQNLALKGQYKQALQDLTDLIETGQEKMAGDQKMIVASKEEVQMLLHKHKVKYAYKPCVSMLDTNLFEHSANLWTFLKGFQ